LTRRNPRFPTNRGWAGRFGGNVDLETTPASNHPSARAFVAECGQQDYNGAPTHLLFDSKNEQRQRRSETSAARRRLQRRVSYETITYDVADTGVATIALNQPETRNALSDELLGELIAALEASRDDPAVRCVVLTSTHEKVFSAGANLAGFAADVPLVHKHFGTERFPRLFRLLGELGKPSICAANGHVLAGALGIALACDLIVARDGARFGTPEINVGAFPFMIMALIYRNVPRKKVAELLLLGEQISAHEAERIGIVNRVLPAEEFEAGVGEWAGKLAGKSPVIMRLGKDAMFRQLDMPLADALDYLRAQLTIAFTTEDIQEGVRAFFEKRDPEWRGR
jgi:enoyl-CoA hydratase/carnithine racemase